MSATHGPHSGLDERLDAGLADVERRLHEVVRHDDDRISLASRHLLDAGGKRFRPLLTLLASELGDGINPEVIEAAVGVELTHLASLYHDDVMDEADTRRGVVSANRAFGNSQAILVGDLLFGRASEVVAGLGAQAVRLQAQTFVRLCAGQIEDDRRALDPADPRGHYLRILADKTGSLISTAAHYGATFGGCDPDVVARLARYGELVGVVFQLGDDLLDIESEESGKAPGTDLREGVTTLPVLLVQQSDDPADAELRGLLGRPLTDDAEHARALRLLRAHPAMAQAHEQIGAYAAEAGELLRGLPESQALERLRQLPAAVAHRSV